MRKIFVSLLALLLPACTTTGSLGVITQNEVDSTRATYDSAMSVAAHYRQLGYCKTGTVWTVALPCADRTLAAKIQAADAAVAKGFNALQAQVTSGNTTGAQAAYATLQTLITAAEALTAGIGAS